ncbi:hypothetical protein T4E_12300 [Trichinella pseudospiralis]|uniref:ZW10 C-terminal helical domain-containing protein n=1 Tax=Trichinella pseudospiralis TaxID=6337 RepID=A0A0V0XUU7_TRIPS|nr:hypothetical protein T4E_12300 [Trichinella pseudospiralis]
MMNSRLNISLIAQLLKHRLESGLREALAENENCGKDVASANQVDETAVCCAKVIGSGEEEELKFYNDLFERFHRLYNDYDEISKCYDGSSDGFVWDYCQRAVMNGISRMEEILMGKADLKPLKMNGSVRLKCNTETPKMSCLRTLEEKWSLLFWLESNSETVELRFGVSRHKLRKTIFSINIVELFNRMLTCLSKRLDENFFNAIIYQNLSSNFNTSLLKFLNEYYSVAIIDKSKSVLQNFFYNFIETWTARCEKSARIKLNLNDKFDAKLLKSNVRCLLRVVVMELLNPVLSMFKISMSKIHHDDYLRNLLQNGLPKACLEMSEVFEKNITRIYLNQMKDVLFFVAYSILTCKSEFHQYVLIENNFENELSLKFTTSSCDQYMKHFVFDNFNDRIHVSNIVYMLTLLIRGIALNIPTVNIRRDEMAICMMEVLEKIILLYECLKYFNADGCGDFFNHDPTVSYVDTFYMTHCLLLSGMQLLGERWSRIHALHSKATLQFQTYINNCSTIVNKYLKSLEEFDGLVDYDSINEYRESLDLLYEEYEQWKIKWQQNLPKDIWQAAIGQLISISVEFFCNIILKMDTFTSVIRKNVRSLISPFISKCRTLFEINNSEEIETVCKNWQRLNEILFVLHSSVNQVAMRWGNVSSPLVLHLTEEELNKILSYISVIYDYNVNCRSEKQICLVVVWIKINGRSNVVCCYSFIVPSQLKSTETEFLTCICFSQAVCCSFT